MGPLVLKAQNILLKKHLQRQASRLGLRFDELIDSSQKAPQMLVAELEQPGVLEEISAWKEKWPECFVALSVTCLLYTSPSPRDGLLSRMPSSA